MGVRYLVPLLLAIVLVACTTTPRHAAPDGGVRYVQVVAHADDDLIFMNPDLASGIRAGHETTGIYLTAGEANKPDAEAYAARRQAGTRAAYARMAGVPDDWRGERLEIDRDHAVELYTLRAKPQLRVVFVNLPEDNDPRAIGGRQALVRLWRDNRDYLRVGTLVPAGGMLDRQYFYTHDDVVASLVKLFDRFRPTVVRTQDPNPDNRYRTDLILYHDHPDHVMAARFAMAAARRYLGPRFTFENFRDYNTSEVPKNLAPADQKAKEDWFGAYVPHDSDSYFGPPYLGWLPRMYQRYPRGSTWAGAGRAYAVFNGQLHEWAGADWKPLPWAGGPLEPGVSAAGDRVVGKRFSDNQIMVLTSGTWQAIGNPSQTAPGDAAQTGSPVATSDGVYVKNGHGGLSWWNGRQWTDLGGTDIQDGLAVAGDRVYASTRDKVLCWHAGQQDTGFHADKPAGPPAAAMTPNGPVVAYRTESGDIAVVTNGTTRMVKGLAGSGNPTVAANGTVFARTFAGGLAASTGDGWQDKPGLVLDQPAPMGSGVVGLGPDGKLHSY